LASQEKIKNEEISIPFVFYDGRSCIVHAPMFEIDINLAPSQALMFLRPMERG